MTDKKFYVARAYLGWRDSSGGAVSDSNLQVYASRHPPHAEVRRSDFGMRVQSDLATELESNGALFGTEVIAVGCSKENLADLAVVDLKDEKLLDQLTTAIGTALGAMAILELVKAASLA